MKKILIAVSLFSFLSCWAAPDTDSLQAAKKWKLWFNNFGFKPKDVVVSVGCGNAWREFELALLSDSINFYLEDIDSVSLNQKTIASKISEFKTHRKHLTHSFTIFYGTITSIPLKDQFADKVIIMNAYHHFDEKPIMLKEINRVLKPGGRLIITDHISPGESKRSSYGCDREYYLLNEKDFMALLETGGFKLLSKTKMDGKTFQFVCQKN